MIKVITDTAADLPISLQEQYNIGILPMNITFGETNYKDQLELDGDTFYTMLQQAKELPRTAYPNLGEIKQALLDGLAAADSVVYITIADQLSGCYKAALVVAEEMDQKRVAIIDSQSATLGQGVVVLAAAKLAAENPDLPLDEFVAAVGEMVQASQGFGVVGNLEYLLKGGRMSLVQAVAATAFNIKPLVQVDPAGSLSLAHKVRGKQKAYRWMVDRVLMDGADYTDTFFVVAYTANREDAVEFQQQLMENITVSEPYLLQIGPTVGTHLGPDCVGAFYLKP